MSVKPNKQPAHHLGSVHPNKASTGPHFPKASNPIKQDQRGTAPKKGGDSSDPTVTGFHKL